MNKIFKDIPGFESDYQVSDDGTVRSLKRTASHGKSTKAYSERILTPFKNKQGYWRIALRKNKEQKKYAVHRLVAMTYIPNPENKPQVNHIDGNKSNNHGKISCRKLAVRYNVNQSTAYRAIHDKTWIEKVTDDNEIGFIIEEV